MKRVNMAGVGGSALVLAAGLGAAGCAHRGPDPVAQAQTLGVNGYLWRATLDTLNFMPLASADPYGGVVITDWYANPEKPDERLKATVYILDTRLRADGISASVFKETYTNGAWQAASVSPDTNVALENAILSRARDLRLSAIDQ